MSQVCRKFTASPPRVYKSAQSAHHPMTTSPTVHHTLRISSQCLAVGLRAKLFVVSDGHDAMFEHVVWCHRLPLIMVVIPGDHRPDGLSQSMSCFVVMRCRGQVNCLMCRAIMRSPNSCSRASPELISPPPAKEQIKIIT